MNAAPIEPAKAVAIGDPDPSLTIEKGNRIGEGEPLDPLVVGADEPCDLKGKPVGGLCPDPDTPLGVLQNPPDQVAGEGVPGKRRRLPPAHLIPIPAAESLPGTEPQESTPVLVNGVHRALGKICLDVGSLESDPRKRFGELGPRRRGKSEEKPGDPPKDVMGNWHMGP